MDLEALLLKIRAVSGVDGKDIDAIATYVTDQNSTINKLKAQQIETNKTIKQATKQADYERAVVKTGYDVDAFKALVESGLIKFDSLAFGDDGKLKVGDQSFDDFLGDRPYLLRSLTLPEETVTPTVSDPVDPVEPTEPKQMGTKKDTSNIPNPVDTLVKDGLFAVP